VTSSGKRSPQIRSRVLWSRRSSIRPVPNKRARHRRRRPGPVAQIGWRGKAGQADIILLPAKLLKTGAAPARGAFARPAQRSALAKPPAAATNGRQLEMLPSIKVTAFGGFAQRFGMEQVQSRFVTVGGRGGADFQNASHQALGSNSISKDGVGCQNLCKSTSTQDGGPRPGWTSFLELS